MKKYIALLLLTILCISCVACGKDNTVQSESTQETAASGQWNSDGVYSDNQGHSVILYYNSKEAGFDSDGWSVTLFIDKDMYSGILQEDAGAIKGEVSPVIPSESAPSSIQITLKEEDGQISLDTGDGKTYHLAPDSDG